MVICMHCQNEISRPGAAPLDTVSHGICVPCFAEQFADVTTQSLSHLASVALERLPMGAILLDHELRVVGYNEAESRLTGLTREKVLGREFFVEIAPCMGSAEVGEWCLQHVHDADVTKKEIDWVLVLRDGKRLAELVCIAGRGRVAVTVTLSPLEVGTGPPPEQ